MPEKPASNEQRLMRLFDALADSVEEMTDEEILAEAPEEGDPKALAAKVTDVIERSIRTHNEGRRLDARQQYEGAIRAMTQRRYALPDTPEERRTLLFSVVAQNPGIRSAVTLHHRELKSLSDQDVEGYLRKLSDLGLLGGEEKGDK